MDQQQRRPLTGGQRAAELLAGLDRLAVDLLDHVTGPQPCVRCTAAGFDVRDHQAARGSHPELTGRFTRQRFDRQAERRRLLGRRGTTTLA